MFPTIDTAPARAAQPATAGIAADRRHEAKALVLAREAGAHLAVEEGSDWAKIGENGVVTAVTLSSTFGVGGGIFNAARRSVKSPLGVKVLTALYPVAAGLASAYVERAVRAKTGVTSTWSPGNDHLLACVNPAVMMVNSYGFLSSRLPGLIASAVSKRGDAVIYAASVASSATLAAATGLIGGAACEALAQHLPPCPRGDHTDAPPSSLQQAAARALSQLPAACFLVYAGLRANAGHPLPQVGSIVRREPAAAIVATGWAGRYALAHAMPALADQPHAADAPQQPRG